MGDTQSHIGTLFHQEESDVSFIPWEVAGGVAIVVVLALVGAALWNGRRRGERP